MPLELLSEEISLTEKSCWETSSLESLAKLKLDFTFVHGLEQVAAAEDPNIVPCDIAYHPTRCRNRQAILNLGQHKLITAIGYCSHVCLHAQLWLAAEVTCVYTLYCLLGSGLLPF